MVDRLTDRISSDPLYLTGFAEGIEQAKSDELRGCPELLSFNFDSDSDQAMEVEGARDGRLLVYSMELLRHLPACFVPIPELPEESATAAAPR